MMNEEEMEAEVRRRMKLRELTFLMWTFHGEMERSFDARDACNVCLHRDKSRYDRQCALCHVVPSGFVRLDPDDGVVYGGGAKHEEDNTK